MSPTWESDVEELHLAISPVHVTGSIVRAARLAENKSGASNGLENRCLELTIHDDYGSNTQLLCMERSAYQLGV